MRCLGGPFCFPGLNLGVLSFAFRLCRTCKAWWKRSPRFISVLDAASTAGSYILRLYPLDVQTLDPNSSSISFASLTRLVTFKSTWDALTHDIGLIEHLLGQQSSLKSIVLSRPHPERLRSATELDRLIRVCGASLSSLALDNLNLAKCTSSLALITSTCTRLDSLSLRGANLVPKSASFLTSLRSLTALFWDFGNADLAAKTGAVQHDMDIIRTLPKLSKLGLVGASGFASVFPAAYSVVNYLDEGNNLEDFISIVEERLPPLVGIRGLMLKNNATLLTSLIARGALPTTIQAIVDAGAAVDSVEFCPGVVSMSPLQSCLLGGADDGIKVAVHENRWDDILLIERVEILLANCAESTNLSRNLLVRVPGTGKNTHASNIFSLAVQVLSDRRNLRYALAQNPTLLITACLALFSRIC